MRYVDEKYGNSTTVWRKVDPTALQGIQIFYQKFKKERWSRTG